MRCLILICILFTPSLYALDSDSIDGETLRLARHVLLQDEIRDHFNLRIGEYQPLDEAALTRVQLDGRERRVVTLRKGTKACVAIVGRKDDRTVVDAWLFFEVEGDLETSAGGGGLVVTSKVKGGDKWPRTTQHARLIRYEDKELELALTFDSRSEHLFEDENYEVVTTARVAGKPGKLKITAVTEYRRQGELIKEGASTRRWKLVEGAGGLTRELEEPGTLDVSTHTSIARRLEREGLEDAALYHARAARKLAAEKKLETSDPRRQEAATLVARLEARLRKEVVER